MFPTVAKAPSRTSEPPIPNRERPAEPQPFQATKEQLLDFYKQMLLIRRFEEKAGQLYGLGLIGGFCHLYIGLEAVAVGLSSALDGDKDSVITGYRDHGHMLAYGNDPKVTGVGEVLSYEKGPVALPPRPLFRRTVRTYFERSTCSKSSSTGVARPKIDTDTLTLDLSKSSSSATPLKLAKGPSSTLTASPIS